MRVLGEALEAGEELVAAGGGILKQIPVFENLQVA